MPNIDKESSNLEKWIGGALLFNNYIDYKISTPGIFRCNSNYSLAAPTIKFKRPLM